MSVPSSFIHHYPGESAILVDPLDGAIVCCGIFGVFEHTGIWIDGNIVELRGNGLIRGISPDRFLQNRSGSVIYVLCDTDNKPLIETNAIDNAIGKLYTFSKYHLMSNNCHKFVWQCISNKHQTITSFYDFNKALYRHFGCKLNWCAVNRANL